MDFDRLIHLSDPAGGTSLLLGIRKEQVEFLHFGPFLGEEIDPKSTHFDPAVPPSSFDGVVAQHLLPSAREGWLGTPGLELSRGARAVVPSLVSSGAMATPSTVVIEQVDEAEQIRVTSTLKLEAGGLFSITHEVLNTAEESLSVSRVAVIAPFDGAAREIVETIGRWAREAHPQRHEIAIGKWVRSTRHGRTGHDAPLLFAVGQRGAGFTSGEVWAAHLAFSGNAEHFVEKLPSGVQVIGAECLLGPGEIILGRGASYATPAVFLAYSSRGLDGLADRFHGYIRGRRGSQSRKVTLNSWEAVFFDHDIARLKEIASLAADVGAERFVLDDGWFLGRRDDTGGLGDWWVDPERWPDGLHPLVEHVRALGMDFGLWIEPEMISERSLLAEKHSQWISTVGDAIPRQWRHQQVLDLTNPDAWQHTFDRIAALVDEYDIAYLKWDMNRDSTIIGNGDRFAVTAQVQAVYRMVDALKQRFPTLEVENCSSGGGRVDLGMVERTDRVWPSDSNDPLERQVTQLWTAQVVPPELIGSHVGPTVAHSTGRAQVLEFRIATSLLFDMGIEWNLLDATHEELGELRRAIAIHKSLRPLIAGGRLVRCDHTDVHTQLFGLVSPDKSFGVYQFTRLATEPMAQSSPQRIPGLDTSARYTVELLYPAAPAALESVPPPWLDHGLVATGAFLASRGLPLPNLMPAQSLLFAVSRYGSDGGSRVRSDGRCSD